MGKTYCSEINCRYTDCPGHQHNAPKDKDICIADLNDGWCFAPANYCFKEDCRRVSCSFHKSKAHPDIVATAIDLDIGCYISPVGREKLLQALCKGTQLTNYRCGKSCKTLYGSDGTCAYCSTLADVIEAELGLIGNTGKMCVFYRT